MLNSLSSSWPTPVVKLLCSHVMHSFHILNAYQQFAILSSLFVFSRFFTTILYSIFFLLSVAFHVVVNKPDEAPRFLSPLGRCVTNSTELGSIPCSAFASFVPQGAHSDPCVYPCYPYDCGPRSPSIYIYIAPPSCTLAPLQTTSGFNL
jgi:hypothetical protein